VSRGGHPLKPARVNALDDTRGRLAGGGDAVKCQRRKETGDACVRRPPWPLMGSDYAHVQTMLAAPAAGQLVQVQLLVACAWEVETGKPAPAAPVAEASGQVTPPDRLKPGRPVQSPLVR